MDLLSPVLKPVRSLLAEESPLHNLEQIETHLLATGEAIRGATESIETHVAALEKLAETLSETMPVLNTTLNTTLPSLVTAVEQLTAKVGVVAGALAPVVHAEADLNKVGHLFGHRHHDGDPAAAGDPASEQG